MKRIHLTTSVAVIVLWVGGPLSRALEHSGVEVAGSGKAEAEKAEGAASEVATIPDAASRPVTVTNSISINGRQVTYSAETGMLPLLKENGDSSASVFYIAYSRLGVDDKAKRPVTFCLNGGPGSSSVWLHLGGLGPRRVILNEDGSMPSPPFGLQDNEYSILHATDLVFIDPVATGYSRAQEDENLEQFFGQSPDVESIGEFIRLWTTRNERWRSPKFVCGESYGAFRGAGLASHLHSRYGMYLNGLILLSGVLDFATLREGSGNPLPSVVFLPTFTATAHYHERLPVDLQEDLDQVLAECRQFATTEYLLALLGGRTVPAETRTNIAARLARYTGLPQKLIEDHELQVSPGVFREQLLRDEGLILGRFDARLTGRDADKTSPHPRFDPSYSAVYGPFAAGMNAYVREELKFTNDLPYEIIAGVKPWNYDDPSRYPSVSGKLASAMSRNPHLRVLVLGGLRDLATPIDGMRHSIDHLEIDPVLRENITWAEYESGHMMYIHLPDLKKLQSDLEEFLTD